MNRVGMTRVRPGQTQRQMVVLVGVGSRCEAVTVEAWDESTETDPDQAVAETDRADE